MHLEENIVPVRSIWKREHSLPTTPGVYAFWWIGDRDELLQSNRHIILKGPRGLPVDVEYRDWWPEEVKWPCLYVGKSTNIKKRFSLHIKKKCLGRLHHPTEGNFKVKPWTTSCQLRLGIEHIFPQEQDPLAVIERNVGFSYNTAFPDNAVTERFFEEDRLVGYYRPWFNIDSER